MSNTRVLLPAYFTAAEGPVFFGASTLLFLSALSFSALSSFSSR